MIYWCWSANSSGGKLTILTMRLAHHFAVWDLAFSISEPSRSRGHAADQIHQETLEKNHHHHHYYSLVIFYIYPAWTLSCVCVHCVMCDVGCGGQIKSLFKRCCVLVFPPSLMTTTPTQIHLSFGHDFSMRSLRDGQRTRANTRAPLIVVLCVTRTPVERKREKQLDYYYHRLCFGDCCFSFHNRVQCVRHEYSQPIQSTFSP